MEVLQRNHDVGNRQWERRQDGFSVLHPKQTPKRNAETKMQIRDGNGGTRYLRMTQSLHQVNFRLFICDSACVRVSVFQNGCRSPLQPSPLSPVMLLKREEQVGSEERVVERFCLILLNHVLVQVVERRNSGNARREIQLREEILRITVKQGFRIA